MRTVFRKLEAWGCNTQKALFNVMGDTEFYRELLHRFLTDQAVKDLEEAVSVGDLPTAIKTSHEIKGTTAILGLDPLNQEISNFLDEIREGDLDAARLKKDYEPVEKELSICYSILQSI